MRLRAEAMLALMVATLCAGVGAAEFEVKDQVEAPRPSAYYMRDTRHYLVPPASPETYRSYQVPVGRGDYLKFVRKHPDRWGDFNPNPDRFLAQAERRGAEGGFSGLFVLAEYIDTGKPEYAAGLNRMLANGKAGWESIVKVYPAKGWVGLYHAQFALYLWLVRRELATRHALTPEAEAGFREGVLYMLDNLHVWDDPSTFWRGPMHRAQGEAWLRRLAVQTWPDLPQAPAWTAYEQVVWNDFWPYRDYPTNDTGYTYAILVPHLLGAELSGKQDFFTDPQMMKVWERLLYTTSPDGSVIPYGAHGGWDSSAGNRLWMFELIARHTKDGRFRWAAQQVFRYLSLVQQPYLSEDWGTDREMYYGAALAYLFADESVKPVPPDGASRVLYRKETLRVRDKRAVLNWLQPFPLFEDKDKGNVCCNLIVTDKVKPDKLVLSSGSSPGDMYMLVDLFPRHDPLNPTAILGLVQYGASFTQTISAKGGSDENRIQIEDMGKTAKLVRNKDPNLVDEYYMEVTVEPFSDHRLATHAVVNVTDYMGFAADLSREFLFVKNRLVLVRDLVKFRDGFQARLGPAWNTQNVAPELGANWANTFMSYLPRHTTYFWPAAPRDLLIYHARRPGRRLDVRLRGEMAHSGLQEAELTVPYGVRYNYEGIVEAGEQLRWSQILLPHDPTVKPGDLAEKIITLGDTPDLVAFAVEAEKGRKELLLLNTPGVEVSLGEMKTDARQVYLDLAEGEVRQVLAVAGSFLVYRGKDIFRQAPRADYERTAPPAKPQP